MSPSVRTPAAESHRATLLEFVTPLLAPSRTLRARRHAMEALSAFAPTGEDVQVELVEAARVKGEWVRTGSSSGRTLYYLHGGGYSLGSPMSHRPLVASLADATRARIFSLDYRRAPESPCPAAVEDAVAGWLWLLEQHDAETPGKIAVAGDSAGGGLALAMTMELVRQRLPLPGALVLLSPWTDLALTGASLDRNAASDVMVTWPVVRKFAADYLGSMDAHDFRASPLYGEFGGFPPMLIQVGDEEMLLDDSTRLAERATSAGVAVTLDVAPGMWHVWQAWARQVPEAAAALERVSKFLDSAVPLPSSPR